LKPISTAVVKPRDPLVGLFCVAVECSAAPQHLVNLESTILGQSTCLLERLLNMRHATVWQNDRFVWLIGTTLTSFLAAAREFIDHRAHLRIIVRSIGLPYIGN